MLYQVKDIVTMLNCRGQIVSPNEPIEQILTDSRHVTFGEKSLFIAISGKQHDGHRYLEEVYKSGVRAFLVEQLPLNPPADANYLLVGNSLEAFQVLAAKHRSSFSIPIIGITGSNGKTIVKEWINHLLKIDFDIIRSPKSYNSQLGVPLSIWELDTQHELGIFEAGISLPGEMDKLQKIIQPTIGIITNITNAHSEGFENDEQKTSEKIKLFSNCNTIIYRKDQAIVAHVLSENKNCISWSTNRNSDANIIITDIEQLNDKTLFTINYNNEPYHIAIPFADEAAIENAIHALVVTLFLLDETEQLNDATVDRITQQAQALPSISMRLELKKGINNCTIINDAYSADIASLDIALRFMQNHADGLNKSLIISDFDESGENAAELYQRIATLLAANKINTIYGIGNNLVEHQLLFKLFNTHFFYTTEEALAQIPNLQFENEIILIKGARRFQLEKIGNLLALKSHGTVLRISLNKLVHNLNVYRNLLNPGVKTMAMVKAFSYGSGQAEIARILANHRVDYLAVAYTDEGVELRKQGIRLPIMVMNAEPESFNQLIQYQLEPEIYSVSLLKTYINSINNKPAAVHIKLDTGMRRLGFEAENVGQLINLLVENKHIRVASIFSHLVGADEAMHDDFTQTQISLFNTIAQKIITAIGYHPILHILNSSGISRFKHAQFDMVRLGIGLYGVDPSAILQKNLLPVGTLQTHIAQLHSVEPGESIGYSRSFVAKQKMRVATINIGYADGYSRRMSNGIGRVYINGNYSPVVGKVCMDMTMIDVSNIPQVTVGDLVEIFGEHIHINDYSQWQETIPYEVMAGISQRVKRVYEEE